MTARMRRLQRREGGFALVEAVIAVAVLGFVTAGAIHALRADKAQRPGLQQQVRSFDELRTAVNRLTAEVRQATDISAQGPATLRMRTLVGGVPSVVVYDASQGSLTRSVDGRPAVAVVARLASSNVFCFGQGCRAQPSPGPGLIGVTLTTPGGQGTTLSTAVRPRVTLAG